MFSIVGSANALLLYLTTSGTQFVVVIFGISLWGKIGKRWNLTHYCLHWKSFVLRGDRGKVTTEIEVKLSLFYWDAAQNVTNKTQQLSLGCWGGEDTLSQMSSWEVGTMSANLLGIFLSRFGLVGAGICTGEGVWPTELTVGVAAVGSRAGVVGLRGLDLSTCGVLGGDMSCDWGDSACRGLETGVSKLTCLFCLVVVLLGVDVDSGVGVPGGEKMCGGEAARGISSLGVVWILGLTYLGLLVTLDSTWNGTSFRKCLRFGSSIRLDPLVFTWYSRILL